MVLHLVSKFDYSLRSDNKPRFPLLWIREDSSSFQSPQSNSIRVKRKNFHLGCVYLTRVSLGFPSSLTRVVKEANGW